MRMTLGDIHKLHLKAAERRDTEAIKKCEGLYLQILDQEPDDWTTLFLLAGIHLYLEKNGMAIALLNRVVSLKETCAEAWNNLGTAYRRQFKEAEAEAAFLKAVELKPNDSDHWNNLGTLHVNEGRPANGIPAFKRALELKPDNHHAQWNLALAYLEMGNYREGFQLYKSGLLSADRTKRTYGAPDWDGSEGKRVIVYGEQGLGDEIMFASILPDAMERADIILDCHPRLENLFNRSFPGLEIHPTRKETVTKWAADAEFDAVIPIGGLCEHFRRDESAFPGTPYLKADDDLTLAMIDRLAALPEDISIGISWKGGKHKTRTDKRSMSLDDMLPLLQTKGINWISLQYTPEAKEEIAAFEAAHGIKIHHWPEVVTAEDYDQTAALVSALDLVVSVNTSVVHLCGALGEPCFTMTPIRKAWRYYSRTGEDMVWYKSVAQIQQTEDGVWDDVVKRARIVVGCLKTAQSGESGEC